MPKVIHPEQVKVIHDHTKHLTTLSAGSIVVLATFHEKLSPGGSWRFLVPTALGLLIFSILAGLLAQIGMINYANPEYHKTSKATAIALLVSWVAFAAAMVALAVFGAKNF